MVSGGQHVLRGGAGGKDPASLRELPRAHGAHIRSDEDQSCFGKEAPGSAALVTSNRVWIEADGAESIAAEQREAAENDVGCWAVERTPADHMDLESEHQHTTASHKNVQEAEAPGDDAIVDQVHVVAHGEGHRSKQVNPERCFRSLNPLVPSDERRGRAAWPCCRTHRWF